MAQRSSQHRPKVQKKQLPQNKSGGNTDVNQQKPIDMNDMTPDNIIHLQRTMGNQFVKNMMQQKRANAQETTPTNGSQKSSTIQRLGGGTRSVHDQDHTVDDPGVNDLTGLTFDYVGMNQNEGMSLFGDNGTGDMGTGGGTSDTLGDVGSVGSIVTGTIGTGMGIYNLTANAMLHAKANKALKEANKDYKGSGTVPGDTELYATVALLERTRTDAIKGEVESVGNILGGISGLINGITGLISGGTAALISGIAFGVGAGLGAIFSTVAAIRDFVAAGKRAKTQKEIGKVRASYIELYNQLDGAAEPLKVQNQERQDKVNALNDEEKEVTRKWALKSKEVVDTNTELEEKRKAYEGEESTSKRQTLIADIMLLKPRIKKLAEERDALEKEANEIYDKAQVIGQQILATADKITEIENRYDQYGEMITALATAQRKQGFGGKIGTGIVNLIGAGGGIALLAATLGAGAAAGPVGWVLSGVALVAIIGYAVGMHIKKKIRKSNVKRMRVEIKHVAEYISTGNLPQASNPDTGGKDGEFPTGYTPSGTPDDRKTDVWHRIMFPTKEKKGWFNKLISKKRSGTMSMQQRIDMMTEYLGKYDTEAQAKVIVRGFVSSLKDGSEGDQTVANPAYSDDLSQELKDNTPETVTLREVNMGLLAYFFGDKANEMKASLLSSDEDKAGAAADLLAKKLKL